MNNRIKRHLHRLLDEEGLPRSAVKRAQCFQYHLDSIEELCALPLSPNEMVEVGRVLLRGSTGGLDPYSRTPVPVLSDTLRLQLRMLFDEDGPCAEAALFVLIQDLRVRAFNRALAKK